MNDFVIRNIKISQKNDDILKFMKKQGMPAQLFINQAINFYFNENKHFFSAKKTERFE